MQLGNALVESEVVVVEPVLETRHQMLPSRVVHPSNQREQEVVISHRNHILGAVGQAIKVPAQALHIKDVLS